MMKSLFSFLTLALLTALPVRGEVVDSLQIYVQAGDSCMQQFNTFEALQNYQRAYEITESQDLRMKLADCHYKRANYRQVAELLKNIPEDSLSHEAFRQLAFNPSSVATYYNIANAYAYLLKDPEQARSYYQQFLEKAAKVEKPTPQLEEMIQKAQEMLSFLFS